MSRSKNDKKKYEKYLSGKMSAEKAHSFEREVLNDLFEQEALEGFESNGSLEAFPDLEKLQSTILGEKKSEFSWMKFAAVVALLIVSSLTVWLVIDPLFDEEELALQSKDEIKVEELPSPEKTIETQVDLPAKMIETEPAETKREEGEKKTIPTLIAEVEPVNTDHDMEILEEVAIIAEPLTAPQGASSGFAFENDQDDAFAEDDVITEDFFDVEPSRLQATGAVVRADKEDSNEMKSKKSLADKTNGQGEEVEKKTRRARAQSRSLSSELGGAQDSSNSSVQPKGGDRAFKKYIKNNLEYPEVAKANKIEGTVVLALTVSSTGTISNIDIKKSLGFGCDAEAIRLVREGPKWIATEKDRSNQVDTVKVRVRFKLD